MAIFFADLSYVHMPEGWTREQYALAVMTGAKPEVRREWRAEGMCLICGVEKTERRGWHCCKMCREARERVVREMRSGE